MSPPSSAPSSRAPDDDALAWELAATARPHLNRTEADGIYIAIGIGEAFIAIEALLTAIVRDQVPLGADLVAIVATWLDCYRGQDAEPRLRRLLSEVKRLPPQHEPAFHQRFGSAL